MQHHEGYAPGWGHAALSMMQRRTATERAGFALPLLASTSRLVESAAGRAASPSGSPKRRPPSRCWGSIAKTPRSRRLGTLPETPR